MSKNRTKALHDFANKTIQNVAFSAQDYEKAELLIGHQALTILWTSKLAFSTRILWEDIDNEKIVNFDEAGKLSLNEEELDDKSQVLASLLELQNYFDKSPQVVATEGQKYTREGMMNRVLKERSARAKKLEYKVKLGKSRNGIHKLTDANGKTYDIVVWDFENELGYIDNIDWRTNRLGTTKHLMYFFSYIKEHPAKLKGRPKKYPFIEITIDPLEDNQVTSFYNRELEAEEQRILKNMFGKNNHLSDTELISKYKYIKKMLKSDAFIVRKEVLEKIQHYFDEEQIASIRDRHQELDYSMMKLTPFDYQKGGVEFCVWKKAAIIADEMGLGKSYQAIVIALLKKRFFNFSKTLIICPASVKDQWKGEIQKFSTAEAIVIQGRQSDRAEQYLRSDPGVFFYITNYESVRRDIAIINRSNFDFVILDEGQKIKNYNTKTAAAINSIVKEHGLVLSGTPIENNLIDLYSIMLFLDRAALTPQWELSQKHCIFDIKKNNKIVGYYNLAKLKERVSSFIIRRQRKEVLKQLPKYIEQDVFVDMTNAQKEIHDINKATIARILRKKFKTQFDWDVIMNCLTSMRMVCDSVYLIDKESHISPKLNELKYILNEQLDLLNNDRKVIIFSEWTTMLDMIENTLLESGYKIIKLTGRVPVKKRQQLIDTFNNEKDCQIFLSSEAGGAGLNLQVADTVINFELPWNPSKKNQRIGRIDRIGQKSDKIQVFNLITPNSIETSIMAGLFMKQNLFDGVLNRDSNIDEVDFSSEGRSQFIKQLEKLIEEEEEMHEPQFVENKNTSEDILSGELVDEDLVNEEAINDLNKSVAVDFDKMESVLQKGMEFLSGIYQMSTGSPLGDGKEPTLNIDKETGEVTMKFRFDI